MTVLVTDGFTSITGWNNPMGTGWNALSASGGTATCNHSFDSAMTNQTVLPANQWAEMQFVLPSASTAGGWGVLVRGTSSGTASFYMLQGTGSNYSLIKDVAGP